MRLSMFFYKHMCATRDIEFLREKAEFTYTEADLESVLWQGDIALSIRIFWLKSG